MNRLTGGQILGLKFITIKVPLTSHTRSLLPLALVNGRQHYTVQQLGHLLLRARDKGNSDALRPSTPLPLTMPAPAILRLHTTLRSSERAVQPVCGNEGVHAQPSSDHAARSDTHSGARSASGSDNSDCHVAGTLRGTSRPHDDTGSDNSDCHVAGTQRGTSRPHITDSTRGEGPCCYVMLPLSQRRRGLPLIPLLNGRFILHSASKNKK